MSQSMVCGLSSSWEQRRLDGKRKSGNAQYARPSQSALAASSLQVCILLVLVKKRGLLQCSFIRQLREEREGGEEHKGKTPLSVPNGRLGLAGEKI